MRTSLKIALRSARREMLNSDQRSLFISEGSTGCLEGWGLRIGMDRRGRVLDNIFVERLWRTVKCEEAYVKGYEDIRRIGRRGFGPHFEFYSDDRPHQTVGYQTPAEVYVGQGGARAGRGGESWRSCCNSSRPTGSSRYSSRGCETILNREDFCPNAISSRSRLISPQRRMCPNA